MIHDTGNTEWMNLVKIKGQANIFLARGRQNMVKLLFVLFSETETTSSTCTTCVC